MWGNPVFEEAAHPRVSGENEKQVWNIPDIYGSSPRERGKHVDVNILLAGRRLIPA